MSELSKLEDQLTMEYVRSEQRGIYDKSGNYQGLYIQWLYRKIAALKTVEGQKPPTNTAGHTLAGVAPTTKQSTKLNCHGCRREPPRPYATCAACSRFEGNRTDWFEAISMKIFPIALDCDPKKAVKRINEIEKQYPDNHPERIKNEEQKANLIKNNNRPLSH